MPAATPAIVARQNALLFRNVRMAQAVCLINVSLLAWVASATVAALPLFLWWLVVVAAALVRVGFAVAYDRTDSEQRTAKALFWQNRMRLGAAAGGLTWALGVVLLMVGQPNVLQLFTALVMAGMVAGAIPLLAADRIAFRLYGWPIALAVTCGALGVDTLHAAFSAMAVLFILAATRSADYFHQALQDTLRLELEKSVLVDELRQAMVKAETSDRAKSEFLANISHELRTPMNGVIGFADLLQQDSPTPEQQELLTPLRQSADQLLALIDNLIDLSALEAGHVRLAPTAFAVSELLDALLHRQANQARAKGLDFITQADPALPLVVIGDVARLRQIIAHLVDNAIKFTDHGSVAVHVRQAERRGERIEIEFRIQDTGIGIERKQLAGIFANFAQGDGSTTRRHAGSGIGLPIAQRLVTLMGGKLTLESEPGHGTTVHVTLPFTLSEHDHSAPT